MILIFMSIEQDADSVTFIHSPFHAGDTLDENGQSTEGYRKLIIAKQRNGQLDEFPVIYDGAKMRFLNDPSADQFYHAATVQPEPTYTFIQSPPPPTYSEQQFEGF